MKRTNYWIAGGIVLVAIAFGVIVFYGSFQREQASFAPGALDSFAQCLKDKGAVFYGAFWCPHCQRTKAEFGDSASKLPYMECSTPDGNGQTQECTDKGITAYPTWIMPDGTRLVGEHTLQDLATASGCPLLTGAVSSTSPAAPAASSAVR